MLFGREGCEKVICAHTKKESLRFKVRQGDVGGFACCLAIRAVCARVQMEAFAVLNFQNEVAGGQGNEGFLYLQEPIYEALVLQNAEARGMHDGNFLRRGLQDGDDLRIITPPMTVGDMHALAASLRQNGAQVFFAGIEE